MATMAVTLDGRVYNVAVVYGSLRRTAAVTDGPNRGQAITGRIIRDVIGTTITYEMQIKAVPSQRADYDAFFQAVTAPVATHTVTFPYGQETITYECIIETVDDSFGGRVNLTNRWDNMTVTFTPVAPQRTPEA